MCPNNEAERRDMKQVPYQMTIGRLLYAVQITCPYFAFVVETFSKFNLKPGQEY